MTLDVPPLAKQLASYPSAYIYDACRRLNLSGATEHLHPLRFGWRLAGPAVTVRLAPRRGTATRPHSLYAILAEATPGSVLAFEYGLDRWVLGGNFVNAALQSGLGGILLDGCVRDVAEIRSLDLPVFCRGAAVRSFAPEYEVAEVGVTIVCAGAQIQPGDYVFGDGDGVVVVPEHQLPAVAHQAEYQAEVEAEQARAIAERRPLEDLMKIQARALQRRSD